ncbi:MAG: hypothetical protein JWP57_256 [Spirosoma sp.]|nr:hypothetical protein [Spirosoma sp.]
MDQQWSGLPVFFTLVIGSLLSFSHIPGAPVQSSSKAPNGTALK